MNRLGFLTALCCLLFASSMQSATQAQLTVARNWVVNGKETDGPSKFSMGEDLQIRLFNDKARVSSTRPGENQAVLRFRFDARRGQTRVLWSGPTTATIYGSEFNKLSAIPKKTEQEAFLQFAEPDPGPNRGTLKNGATWGHNVFLVSDSSNQSIASKPCAFVFELIDGDSDGKFNSESDQVVLHGVAYDANFLSGESNKNLATILTAVRTAFRIRIRR